MVSETLAQQLEKVVEGRYSTPTLPSPGFVKQAMLKLLMFSCFTKPVFSDLGKSKGEIFYL